MKWCALYLQQQQFSCDMKFGFLLQLHEELKSAYLFDMVDFDKNEESSWIHAHMA
jgi:hypothetical protein